MNKTAYLLLIISVIVIFGCSSSKQATDENKQDKSEIYVFDDVEKADSSNEAVGDTVKTVSSDQIIDDSEKVKSDSTSIPEFQTKYIIQVGAFTVNEHAENFVKQNQSKIDYKMKIAFNDSTHLFLIQLPPFDSRETAESVRNAIWKIPVFRDAFIITIRE